MKQKHCCRFCNKSFPSGRSLGGHMRSHLSSFGSGAGEKIMGRKKRKKTSCSINIGESYSLRVNPKKTWRLYDSPGVRPRPTRQGQYSVSSSASEVEQEQEDGAISLMILSMDAGFWPGIDSWDDKSSVGKGFELDGSRDGCSGILCNKSSIDCSHVEVMGTEFGKRIMGCESSPEEASKKSSELNSETLSCSKKIDGAGKRVRDVADGGVVNKRNKYECATCNKAFHSHQALGGHIASPKKLKESLENSTNKVVSSTVMIEEEVKSCKLESPIDEAVVAGECCDLDTRSINKSSECPICFNVSASDQALGDHKRSHLSTDLDATTDQASPIHDLLDLNLPAPIDEDGFKSWWIGSNNEHGPLVGLISN